MLIRKQEKKEIGTSKLDIKKRKKEEREEWEHNSRWGEVMVVEV